MHRALRAARFGGGVLAGFAASAGALTVADSVFAQNDDGGAEAGDGRAHAVACRPLVMCGPSGAGKR